MALHEWSAFEYLPRSGESLCGNVKLWSILGIESVRQGNESWRTRPSLPWAEMSKSDTKCTPKDMTAAAQETAPKQEASSITLKGTAAASTESSHCEVPPTTPCSTTEDPRPPKASFRLSPTQSSSPHEATSCNIAQCSLRSLWDCSTGNEHIQHERIHRYPNAKASERRAT
jgi:hypothetical protein